MADTGWVIAGTGTSVNDADPWVNPGNVTIDDDSFAHSGTAGGNTSYLRAQAFGFDLPVDATIAGIEVRLRRSSSTAGLSKDVNLQLTLDGTLAGDNKADTSTTWPKTMATVDYGGATDLWGFSLSPSNVNDGSFGIYFRGSSGDKESLRVYAIAMRVHYEEQSANFYGRSSGVWVPGDLSERVAGVHIPGQLMERSGGIWK